MLLLMPKRLPTPALEDCNTNPGLPGNHMVTTFDFSTLYTTLPHDDLIRCLVALYNKYFTGDIGILFRSKKIIISKEDFVQILKFCICNSYTVYCMMIKYLDKLKAFLWDLTIVPMLLIYIYNFVSKSFLK